MSNRTSAFPLRILVPVFIMVIVGLLLIAGLASATTEHCPAGGVKTEANGGTQAAINDTVLPAGTLACVKAGTVANSFTADGTTTLQGYAFEGKDVSYFVIYESDQSTPTPEVTPSSTPTPTPSASPTASPTVDASPTPSTTPSPTLTLPSATPTLTGPTENVPPDTAMTGSGTPSVDWVLVFGLLIAGGIVGSSATIVLALTMKPTE